MRICHGRHIRQRSCPPLISDDVETQKKAKASRVAEPDGEMARLTKQKLDLEEGMARA